MDDFNTYKKPDPKDLPFDPSRRNENDFPESAHETVYSSSDLSFEGSFEEDNRVLEIGKGVIGALIGSIPGIIIWILIGRFGIIASLSGAILAGGVFMGYKFTQKNEVLSKRTGIIICVLVIIFAIHISQKISWCMQLSDFYARYVDDLKDSLYALGELIHVLAGELVRISIYVDPHDFSAPGEVFRKEGAEIFPLQHQHQRREQAHEQNIPEAFRYNGAQGFIGRQKALAFGIPGGVFDHIGQSYRFSNAGKEEIDRAADVVGVETAEDRGPLIQGKQEHSPAQAPDQE